MKAHGGTVSSWIAPQVAPLSHCGSHWRRALSKMQASHGDLDQQVSRRIRHSSARGSQRLAARTSPFTPQLRRRPKRLRQVAGCMQSGSVTLAASPPCYAPRSHCAAWSRYADLAAGHSLAAALRGTGMGRLLMTDQRAARKAWTVPCPPI